MYKSINYSECSKSVVPTGGVGAWKKEITSVQEAGQIKKTSQNYQWVSIINLGTRGLNNFLNEVRN